MKSKNLLQMISDSRGAISIIMIVALVILLIIAAFVIDFGLVYLRTADIQNASDSAALAAASLLPVEYGDNSAIQDVNQKAIEYLEKNGVSGEDYTIDVQLNLGANNLYTSVTVDVYKQEKLFIAPVIGITHLDVNRTATAQISPTISVTGVVPLSMEKEYLESAKASGLTDNLTLKYAASDEEVYMGAFGAIDLDGVVGGGANDYNDRLEYGYQGSLKIGQVLPVEPGNMSNPTKDGIEYRMDLCTHYPPNGCTAEHYVETCPRVVIVPVVTYTFEKKQTKEVTIVGFTVFLIEEVKGQGNKSEVIGSFLKDIVVNGEGSLDDYIGGSYDFGVYSISLID
jgi:Flp pilus assembly protein TadG